MDGLGSNLLVHTIVAHLVHSQGQLMIDAQGLRYRVVVEGRHHDVLATEVTDDVGCFKMGLDSRIESILAVHLTVGVGYAFGVDLTAEIAFGRSDLNVFIIDESALDYADLHLGHVADDGRNRELGKIGSTGFEHRSHLRDGNDLLDAVGRAHSRHGESAQREVNNDLLLAARDQLDLWSGRRVAVNADPLLGHRHHGHGQKHE